MVRGCGVAGAGISRSSWNGLGSLGIVIVTPGIVPARDLEHLGGRHAWDKRGWMSSKTPPKKSCESTIPLQGSEIPQGHTEKRGKAPIRYFPVLGAVIPHPGG